MGVREAQDGKPCLLLDDTRNLVQRVSKLGTAGRWWWVGVVREGPVALGVDLLIAAARAVGYTRK